MGDPVRLDYDEAMNQWAITVSDGKGGEQSAVLPGSIVDALAQRVTTQRAVSAAIRSGVQAQVTCVQWANLGDSAAYIRRPLTYDPQETVLSLLVRAHDLGSMYHRHDDGDRVELQVIPETVPKVEARTGLSPLDF